MHQTRPPNTFLGIRVGRIDHSDEVWQRSHKKALPWTYLAGAVATLCIVISLICMNDPVLRIRFIVIGFFAVLGFGTVMLLVAYLEARRLTAGVTLEQ